MMKLVLTLEADSVNVQALNMGRIVVDIDGVNITELINKVAENGYSLRVVDERDSKNTLGSISKRDDVYIRTLLFHGAKTVSNARKGRQVQESWLGRPVSRRNKNVATVALNNKNARVLWVLLTNDKEISPEEVMGAAYM